MEVARFMKEERRKILVVDDNEDNRELVSKILRLKGYCIIEAMDGKGAIKMAEEERPDLILMDISIPDIDGYEATRIIKSKEELKAIPIVALTAHAMKGDMEKALEAGCDGYIPKPIDIHSFPDQVGLFLRKAP